MQRILSIFIIVLALVVTPVAAQSERGIPVAASVNRRSVVAWLQDVPPPVPPVFEAPDLNEVIQAGLLALLAAFSTGILSPLTAQVVQLFKVLTKDLPYFKNWSGDAWNLSVAILLSAVVWGAAALGFSQQLNTIYGVLAALLAILLPTGVNFVYNRAVYNFAKSRKIPLAGYSRTP